MANGILTKQAEVGWSPHTVSLYNTLRAGARYIRT